MSIKQIDIERCWRADEAVRYNETLRRDTLRSFWRKKILDIEDLKLPDYDRPLWKCPPKRRVSLPALMVNLIIAILP